MASAWDIYTSWKKNGCVRPTRAHMSHEGRHRQADVARAAALGVRQRDEAHPRRLAELILIMVAMLWRRRFFFLLACVSWLLWPAAMRRGGVQAPKSRAR